MPTPADAPLTARLLYRLTHPPTAPLRQLSLYYGLLVIIGALLVATFPLVRDAIAGLPTAGSADASDMRDTFMVASTGRPDYLRFDLNMGLVLMGTLLVTIPFSWGYMSVRQHVGYEQSVVQTLVVLPVVVAGIMMIVQFSLALAFALGGVAAAVRFRNTLKDVADAVYVFLAIGIGIAAGTGALSAALVMSAFFTYTAVLLWRCNFGECELSVVTAQAARASALRRPDSAEKSERRRGRRHTLAVTIHDVSAQAAVEAVLNTLTRRWRMRDQTFGAAGETVNHYALRLKRSIPIERLTRAIAQAAVPTAPSPSLVATISS